MAKNRDSVIFDANILYSAPLRDFLLRLAAHGGLFRAKWTDEIHDEWIRNLRKNRSDLSSANLAKTRELINRAVPDALIEKNLYEPFIKGLDLPDPGDRHVLEAAIVSQSRYIVTFNTKDFPESLLQNYQIDAKHPDEFVSELFNLDAAKVLWILQAQQKALKNPPKTLEEVIAYLVKNGLVSSMAQMKALL